MAPKQGTQKKASAAKDATLLKAENIKDPVLRRLCYSIIVLRQFRLHLSRTIEAIESQPAWQRDYSSVFQNLRDRDIIKYTHDLAVLLIAYKETHDSETSAAEQLLRQQASHLLIVVENHMSWFIEILNKSIAKQPEENDPYILWLNHRRDTAVFPEERDFWHRMATDALIKSICRKPTRLSALTPKKRKARESDSEQKAKRRKKRDSDEMQEVIREWEWDSRDFRTPWESAGPRRPLYTMPSDSGSQQKPWGSEGSEESPLSPGWFFPGQSDSDAAEVKSSRSTPKPAEDSDWELAVALQEQYDKDSSEKIKQGLAAALQEEYDKDSAEKSKGGRSEHAEPRSPLLGEGNDGLQASDDAEDNFRATEDEAQEWQQRWTNLLSGCDNFPDDWEKASQTATDLYDQCVEAMRPLAKKFNKLKGYIDKEQGDLPDLMQMIQNAESDADRQAHQEKIEGLFGLTDRPRTQTLGFASYDEAVENYQAFETTADVIDRMRLFAARCQIGHLEKTSVQGHANTHFQPV